MNGRKRRWLLPAFSSVRASHGKAGALSMAGCSRRAAAQQFFESHPGRCNGLSSGICAEHCTYGPKALACACIGCGFSREHAGRKHAVFAVAKAPDAEIGGACLEVKGLFNVTSFRGSPPFLSSLLSSHRALPAPRASRHLARLWRAVPRLHPRRPRLRFKFFRAPDFAPRASLFLGRGWCFGVCGRVRRRLPFRRAFPLWEPFSF